ncbi:ABC transporter permease [Demequina lignilytica]|uniref:ABC transporter permease n=1 Tax=Demequina lignilytica TaxID=3051663 RepID=A0AB35MGP9_9MICO|nr:ABC transporter permease [Demequina sp. SYSU T0a273]MDN4482967.1 ABC transporter permease [Demequina sp. SYSU T0a273]
MSAEVDKTETAEAGKPPRDTRALLREIAESNSLVVVLAVVASLIIGGFLIVLASPAVEEALGYFFARPADTFKAAWDAVSSAYTAMFRGAVWNYNGDTFAQQFRPITETLTMATPLIFAGLGLGMGFRAGLFNIGAQGQMMIGAMLGAYVGFAWNLPPVLHLIVAVTACALGGALWGFIPGILKARTGAHEVIVTIMLNYVAANLLGFALSKDAFQRPGSDNPQSPAVADSAAYPLILGDDYRLHLGFIVALLAAVGVWWLMERSTWGFRFRAVGANPNAAKTAGMNVSIAIVGVMTIAGALAGLAGSAQILGTERSLTAGIAGSFGFDAITVALLGRSRPLGTVMAAILFGGLRAAGPALQVQAQLPIDIVLIIQSLIVLFIAAPPLVRFLFRLPAPSREKVVTA